jgi:hypothetical protein
MTPSKEFEVPKWMWVVIAVSGLIALGSWLTFILDV